MGNVGTCRTDVKGEAQVEPHESESTDAEHRGGLTRSSEGISVMEMERRGWIVQLCLMDQPEMGGIFRIK